MNYFFRILCLCALSLVMYSCKNETKEVQQEENVLPEKKVLTEKDKNE